MVWQTEARAETTADPARVWALWEDRAIVCVYFLAVLGSVVVWGLTELF
jgi:hypothetical protein